jgi:hypothetical protein
MQAVVMYGGGGGGCGGVKGSINTKSLAVGFRALKSQKQHYTSSLDFSNRNSQLSSSSFGLRLNSLSSSSMATELTRSSLFHSRPVLKALASGLSVLIVFILFYFICEVTCLIWIKIFFLDGGDVEEVRPLKSEDDVTRAVPVPQQQQGKASVLPFVGVACLGAILFGYHLG